MADAMLDRPVWSALATEHAKLSIGTPHARRFAPDISPFAATDDESPESLAELGALIAADGPVVIAQADPIVTPAGTSAASMAFAAQMLFDAPTLPEPKGLPIRRLGAQDAPAMLALATLTRPGPFAARTYLLGDYWGIEHDGALVAMAGERLKQPGFTELSGVCAHPDHQGRGYARELCLVVLHGILRRGEQPYLHVYTTNQPALALYRSLGFRERRQMHVAQLAAAPTHPVVSARGQGLHAG